MMFDLGLPLGLPPGWLPPGLVMMLGAVAVPFLPPLARPIWMLLAIALSATTLLAPTGEHVLWSVLGFELSLYYVDGLSFPFSLVFHLAAALAVIYSWHVQSRLELTAGLAYAGAAIAAVHAGDLLSLFIWWELTAITSVFVLLAAGTYAARQAAMRYLVVQVASGVLLLGGAGLFYIENGHIVFTMLTLDGWAGWFILLAFGIKAAFPLLNGWLQDAYPKATPSGAVILSIFTTKLAIYALARGFAGTEILVWIGAVMAVFPLIFILIENDLRRVLAFSLNNQLGFMVVAIGVGTPLALNGAVALAFVHILYKALLFMALGNVLYQTGTVKASELGGLYRHMPLTMLCCIIGVLAMVAAPLLGSFVAKTQIMTALGDGAGGAEFIGVYMMLLLASAAIHGSIKIPYFTFFARPNQRKVGKTPLGMGIAMGATAVLCVVFGMFPWLLYAILPYAKVKNPYDLSHITGHLQLLLFAMLAFVVLLRLGLYPPHMRETLLNSDWFYRRLAPKRIKLLMVWVLTLCKASDQRLGTALMRIIAGARWIANHPIAGPVIPGPAALVQVLVLLLIIAILYVNLL